MPLALIHFCRSIDWSINFDKIGRSRRVACDGNRSSIWSRIIVTRNIEHIPSCYKIRSIQMSYVQCTRKSGTERCEFVSDAVDCLARDSIRHCTYGGDERPLSCRDLSRDIGNGTSIVCDAIADPNICRDLGCGKCGDSIGNGNRRGSGFMIIGILTNGIVDRCCCIRSLDS